MLTEQPSNASEEKLPVLYNVNRGKTWYQRQGRKTIQQVATAGKHVTVSKRGRAPNAGKYRNRGKTFDRLGWHRYHSREMCASYVQCNPQLFWKFRLVRKQCTSSELNKQRLLFSLENEQAACLKMTKKAFCSRIEKEDEGRDCGLEMQRLMGFWS